MHGIDLMLNHNGNGMTTRFIVFGFLRNGIIFYYIRFVLYLIFDTWNQYRMQS